MSTPPAEPVRLPTRVWYLELAELRPARTAAAVRRAEEPFGPLNRFFYTEVGRGYHWLDRAGWDETRWQAWSASVETWIVVDRGSPAGYAELEPRGTGQVDIASLGLLPPFRGRGLGGALLTEVTRRALTLGGDHASVTVNTCELDGAHARAAYEARGFRVVREAVELRARSPAAD